MTVETVPAAPAAAIDPAVTPAPQGAPAPVPAQPAPAEAADQKAVPTTPVPSDPAKEERKRTLQARMNEVVSQKHAAERRARAAEERAQQLESLLQQVQPDTLDDMGRVMVAIKKNNLDESREVATAARHEAIAARSEAFKAKVEMARDSIPDIDATLREWTRYDLAPAAQDLIAESDHGALIAYHLARNPNVQGYINTLPPHLIGREIARIEAQIAPYPVKRISQAPAPVQTVAGNASQGGSNAPPDNFADYEKWRLARMT